MAVNALFIFKKVSNTPQNTTISVLQCISLQFTNMHIINICFVSFWIIENFQTSLCGSNKKMSVNFCQLISFRYIQISTFGHVTDLPTIQVIFWNVYSHNFVTIYYMIVSVIKPKIQHIQYTNDHSRLEKWSNEKESIFGASSINQEELESNTFHST